MAAKSYSMIFKVKDRGFIEPHLADMTMQNLLSTWGESFNKEDKSEYLFEFTVTKDGLIKDAVIESLEVENPELVAFLLTEILGLKGISPAMKKRRADGFSRA